MPCTASGSVIHSIRYSLICRLGHGRPVSFLTRSPPEPATARWKRRRMWRWPWARRRGRRGGHRPDRLVRNVGPGSPDRPRPRTPEHRGDNCARDGLGPAEERCPLNRAIVRSCWLHDCLWVRRGLVVTWCSPACRRDARGARRTRVVHASGARSRRPGWIHEARAPRRSRPADCQTTRTALCTGAFMCAPGWTAIGGDLNEIGCVSVARF